MRISAAQRSQTENRIRAAMDRLLRGEVPPGGSCDVKTLAREASVDRTAFYGNRPYAHLRNEFEHRLQQLQHAGETPDPKAAQIERLKADVGKLRNTLAQANSAISEMAEFRTQALARLAAQHDEILRLRAAAAAPKANVARLPATRRKVIGPC
jgi:chromosome segregation ATPase